MTERDYINILKDRKIEYRSRLNLPKEITFGLEIEYENVLNKLVTLHLKEETRNSSIFYDWINKREIDLSIRDKENQLMNGEINSPILVDNIRNWKNLRTALNILKKDGAIITNQCGGHVNIGAHVFGYNVKYWRNFILLWILYEKEIYDFSSGEFSKIRRRDDKTIDRISPVLKNNLSNVIQLANSDLDIYDYLEKSGFMLLDKSHDISLINFIYPSFVIDNRIEFRIPNGTLREEIWQNYVNFFAKFLIACKKELDIDKVVYKIIRDDHNSVELADYIFHDNIDKDNFLIQTLKTDKTYRKELLPHIEKY